MRGGCISAFSVLGNNNLAFIMAANFGRAGQDESKSLCKSCQKEGPLLWWDCTYDELGQSAANGCPGCRFVAACITAIKEYLENEITGVKGYPGSNEFYLETEIGDFYLDIFIEDPETGESSGYWPTNSTNLSRQTWKRPTWRVR